MYECHILEASRWKLLTLDSSPGHQIHSVLLPCQLQAVERVAKDVSRISIRACGHRLQQGMQLTNPSTYLSQPSRTQGPKQLLPNVVLNKYAVFTITRISWLAFFSVHAICLTI